LWENLSNEKQKQKKEPQQNKKEIYQWQAMMERQKVHVMLLHPTQTFFLQING